jgi:hypothetical protein
MCRTIRFNLVLAGCICFLGVSPLHAGWIDEGVQVSSEPGAEMTPVMTTDGQGGGIVVWQDYRSGADPDLYAQRVDANGNARWALSGVPVCVQPGVQTNADIASDGSGGAIVVWHDERNIANWQDIYAQRLDANGNVLWNVDGILIDGGPGPQVQPHLVSDGQHGAIIGWEDGPSLGQTDIYAQRVSAAGLMLWTAGGVAICTAAYDQAQLAMDSDGAGGAWFAWGDRRSGNYDIWAQKVNASGTLQGTYNGALVCVATGNQEYPDLVSDGLGGAIIAWAHNSGADSTDIYAQHMMMPAGATWSPGGRPICTAQGMQTGVVLGPDSQYGAFLLWRDSRSGDFDLYAQRVSLAGLAVWPSDGLLVCGAAGYQFPFAITPDGSGAGGAILSWEDWRQGAAASDIYVQKIDASGNMGWEANGRPICDAPAEQRRPAVVADGSGGAVLAWMDNRAGTANWDIYAQSTAFSPSSGVENTPSPGLADVSCSPNPSSSSTRISFRLVRAGVVSLEICDAAGRLVRAVAAGHYEPGMRSVDWDGKSDDGHVVPSGVYFCRVSGPDLDVVRRVNRTR